jgi:diguanylate cyclase (GGDEF)-like protein
MSVATGAELVTSAEAERIDALLARDGTDEGSEDFWVEHLRSGLMLFTAATVLAAVYLWRTPDGAHRTLEWGMVVVSIVATGIVVSLPRSAIIRSPRRLVFFVTWSAFSCVFAATVAAFDGGLRSPLAAFVLIPIVYASLAYPARAVVGIGFVGAVSASVAALSQDSTLAETLVFVGVIAMVTLLCASVTRSRRAQQAARRELTERLVEMATRDGLTGCLNHRTFYDALEVELARAVRYELGISLLVIDVDDFKSINDTLGHLAGDEVLRGIGTALMTAGRVTDLVGRIGGDEFAVLLLGTDQAQADAAAKRLIDAVAEMVLPLPVPRTVAITVGVAHLDRPSVDDTPRQIVALADAQLYGRKVRLGDVIGTTPNGAHPER